MPRFPLLESRQNPNFKMWMGFAEHPEEPDCPWLPVEGWKNLADLADQPIELLLFVHTEEPRLASLLPQAREVVQLAPRLMDAISQVKSHQSVLAFVQKPEWAWDRLTSWVLYLDRLQDPGNLGTLFRTARATGFFSLVTSPDTVSCFNSKVVRASVASLYSVPFIQGVGLEELRDRGYVVWGAVPAGGRLLYQTPFEPAAAFVIGNEGAGLDPLLLKDSDSRLTIPMQDESESLNAGVAGSLIMYEVYRQRMLL
ncbi:MAG: RNA methyltransferase [Acidobacteria bacterium]|nr:MAG: RNA methyltransferase [Acidobacteriota bacterium]